MPAVTAVGTALWERANIRVHLGKTRAWNAAGEEPSALLFHRGLTEKGPEKKSNGKSIPDLERKQSNGNSIPDFKRKWKLTSRVSKGSSSNTKSNRNIPDLKRKFRQY